MKWSTIHAVASVFVIVNLFVWLMAWSFGVNLTYVCWGCLVGSGVGFFDWFVFTPLARQEQANIIIVTNKKTNEGK